jgi:hypothetical protein
MIQFAIRTYYSSRPVMGDWKYYSGRVLFQKNFHHRWIRYHTPRPLSTKSDTMDFTSDHYWYLRQFNFLYNHNINNDNDATLDENNDNDRNSTMRSLGTTTCNVRSFGCYSNREKLNHIVGYFVTPRTDYYI